MQPFTWHTHHSKYETFGTIHANSRWKQEYIWTEKNSY